MTSCTITLARWACVDRWVLSKKKLWRRIKIEGAETSKEQLLRVTGWAVAGGRQLRGEREQAECGIFVGCRRDDCCRGDGPEQQH